MDFRLLKPRSQVRSKFELHRMRIQRWRHARECADIKDGTVASTVFEVVEAGYSPTKWAKVLLPARSPAAHLKISAEEVAWGFDPA